MKRLCFLFLFISSQLLGMNVSFKYGVFMTPNMETYIETYLLFDAAEMRYQLNDDSSYSSGAELTYIFESDKGIVAYSKNLVKGIPTKDTLTNLIDFVDQQRFTLSPGHYTLVIELRDINNRKDSVSSKQSIDIKVSPTSTFFSDIYLVDHSEKTDKSSVYTRGGTNYYPRLSPYYPDLATELYFYCELYNINSELGEDVPYLVSVEIIDATTEEVIDPYRSIVRKKAQSLTPISMKLNISNLKAGSYVLRLQARNRENALVTERKLPFKRFRNQPDLSPDSNNIELNRTFVSKLSTDSLREMCYCLIYKGSDAESNYIEEHWRKGDEAELRYFFYSFWAERNALDPESEWYKYYGLIKHTIDAYGNNTQHGCATDRGRIYLKYGKPNSMSIVRNESHSYPYEIWHYYRIPEKSNAKFFFLDQKKLNEYVLAHSNVIGEPRDALWYTRVVAETMSGTQSTKERSEEILGTENDQYSHGSRALDYWNNPR
jgi:GWxTD domain-containing protein